MQIGFCIPPERLSGLLGPKAEKALTGPKLGLLVVSIGLHSPELKKKKKMHNDIINILVKSDGEDD